MTRSRVPLVVAALIVATHATGAHAQSCLPFAPGERLTFTIRAAFMGAKGQGKMTVAGPELIRGQSTIVLRSETSVGVGFLNGTDRTTSWVDPVAFAALRFIQVERHIIAHATDSVEMFPAARLWERAQGRTGATASDAPLDVLSFIYYLRTLPFGPDSSWTVNRHFDMDRNPTTVRVTGHDTVTTAAGTFPVWNVEMSVRDKDHYGGDGVIKLQFSDDARRLPVRIQSVMPVVGTTVMTLASVKRDSSTSCSVIADSHPRSR